MILDFIHTYQIPLFILCEIILLLILYRTVLRGWVIDKFEEKVTEDEGEWLKEIFYPLTDSVVEQILTYAPDVIITKVKQEILASQGTLTRVANVEPANEMEAGLGIAEHLLKSMGWKSPNALLVAKMAGALGNMVGEKEEKVAEGTSPLPIGDSLI